MRSPFSASTCATGRTAPFGRHHLRGADFVDLHDVRSVARALRRQRRDHHLFVAALVLGDDAEFLLRFVVALDQRLEFAAPPPLIACQRRISCCAAAEPQNTARIIETRVRRIGRGLYGGMMRSMASMHELDAFRLQRNMPAARCRRWTVARDCLARIDAWEPKLNAMYRIDREGPMARRRSSETRWRAGKPLSPLDGVPVTIKENIYTRGDPAPIGTRANDDARRNRRTRLPPPGCARRVA
jgi:hypothetical protein